MTILSWNCRGLGNLRTVRDLCRMVKEKRPSMVFLMETKLRKDKMEVIRYKLGFKCMFVVDCVGKSGGLALLWGDEILVEIQNFSHRHINGVIQSICSDATWKFTGFYGHPNVAKRQEAWSLLKVLGHLSPIPWLCIGDFNEIVSLSEKWGGGGRANSQMRNFQDALTTCELSDLGFRGPKYTWSNCQEGQNLIKERLDRGVANSAWCELFPAAEVLVDFSWNSDHALLILKLRGQQQYRARRSFRYEASWALDKEYKNLIVSAWNQPLRSNSEWDKVQQKLSRCTGDTIRWQKRKGGPIQTTIQSLKAKLNFLQGEDEELLGSEAKLVKEELQVLLDQENLQWQQRAKTEWLKYGDRNTKFFHACASQRKKLNQIIKIEDETGAAWESKVDIEKAFVDYFSGLFLAGFAGDLEPCLKNLEARVSQAMNDELMKPFMAEEVNFALHQMAPLKAPGPDGLSAGFFQSHWELMGTEVCRAVLDILNSGVMPPLLNRTHIVLIPKVRNPICVTDFRPISLCNVLYKLISKVLANRLKKILPDIISPTQSAFIPGRLITDNILAAYETLHTMHSRLSGKKSFMAVKLDMSKAYDRVEWHFLEEAMKKLGFDARWIRLVMMCVQSVQYAVVVNGVPCGEINPSRGLRQGDPISPYLFLICSEVLSSMVTQANQDGVLTGVPTSRRGPRVSHLFFADDSLLFCRANLSQWEALTRLLRQYEEASGQRLNNNKTIIRWLFILAGMPWW
jgi:hypothetical protein